MPDGGRVIAITYAPGGRYGSWQSWVAMGAAKSALEALARYFAVALAPRGITVNSHQPGLGRGQRAQRAAGAGGADDPRPSPEAAGRRCAGSGRRPTSATP